MTVLEEALRYASHGWNVVPDHGLTKDNRCTCPDPNCNSPGKHPRMERGSVEERYRREGTTSTTLIKSWWQRWPDSNLAIVCGGSSNLVVVDVDPRNGGLDTLTDLLSNYGGRLKTRTAQSGGGGLHLYFSHPGGEKIRNRIGLLPGIDIKADGGRIVAPPSKHHSGGTYHWIYEGPTAPLPRTLLHKIQNEKGTGTWQVMRGHRQRF